MRVAVPIHGGAFCAHFGRADGFYVCEADPVSKRIEQARQMVRRPKGCESLPVWLRQLGVEVVVAGGVGAAARQNLRQLGIEVCAGHSGPDPQGVIADYLAGAAPPQSDPCAGLTRRRRHCRGK